MKGFELLPIPEDLKKKITSFVDPYKNEQIYFSIKEVADNEVIIRVVQKEKPDNNYLTKKELIELVKGLFMDTLAPRVVHVHPIPFVKDKIEDYTSEKVLTEMEELELSIKNLGKLLNIDKTSLTRLLSSGNVLSQLEKAMFYYLFRFLDSKNKIAE